MGHIQQQTLNSSSFPVFLLAIVIMIMFTATAGLIGVMKNMSWMQMQPWLALGPGCAIFITALGFNLCGDGLRDALDPRLT